jgi:hypothetical protein
MAMISPARTKIKAEAGHSCLIPRKTLRITYVPVNNCIYFKYSLCTLKPAEKLSACSPASMPYKDLGTISTIYGPIFNESLS